MRGLLSKAYLTATWYVCTESDMTVTSTPTMQQNMNARAHQAKFGKSLSRTSEMTALTKAIRNASCIKNNQYLSSFYLVLFSHQGKRTYCGNRNRRERKGIAYDSAKRKAWSASIVLPRAVFHLSVGGRL